MIGMFTWLPISDRNNRRTEYSGGNPSFLKARPIRSIVIRKKTTPSINNNRKIKEVVILLETKRDILSYIPIQLFPILLSSSHLSGKSIKDKKEDGKAT